MRRFLKLLVLLVLVNVITGGYTESGKAYAFSVNLDPPSVQLTLAPGETKQGTITLQNLDSTKRQYRVYINDWIYLPDGSKQFQDAKTTPFSCAGWLELDTTEFEIDGTSGSAISSKKITYKISAPQGAAGGYYAVVFFESILGVNSEKINLAGRIGTIFYIEIKDTLVQKGEISSFKVYPGKTSAKVQLTFRNLGNVRLTPHGTLVLADHNNQVVQKENIFGLNTLPGDALKKEYKLDAAEDDYEVFLSLDYGGDSLAVARTGIESSAKSKYADKEVEKRIRIEKMTIQQTNKKELRAYARISNIGIYTEPLQLLLNVFNGIDLIEVIHLKGLDTLNPKSQALFEGGGNHQLKPGKYRVELTVKLSEDDVVVEEQNISVR
ncbi:MAG: hypothetical protein ABIH39_00365 [Candidatus Margulisiibacteriota bacterium]